MIVKGNLIGFRTAKSQKGNDCFFGYIATEDPQDHNLEGMKATVINAFGSDATALYKKVCEKKLLDKNVAVNGYYNNNNFYAVTIDLL